MTEMTESGKQKLRLLSIFLLIVGVLFVLEGKAELGWQTGMALLSVSVLTAIDFYLNRGKLHRITYAAFSLFFLSYAVINFLAH